MTLSANAVQAKLSASPVASALADGHLDAALDLARSQVKAAPSSAEARLLLAELNLLAGDLEKADLHAHHAGLHRPEWVPGLSVFRAHLRGLHARQAFFDQAALPAFAGEPDAADHLSMRLAIALCGGNAAEIAAARDAVLQAPASVLAAIDGGAPAAFCGLDDRLIRTIEVVTAGGDYVRVDVDKIDRIIFDTAAQRRPRHIALRPARLVLKSGDSADCAIPALYPAAGRDAQESALRLGQSSDWQERNGVTAGIGQICWLVGDDVVALQEIGEVRFHAA